MFSTILKKFHLDRIPREIVIMWLVIFGLCGILFLLIDFSSEETGILKAPSGEHATTPTLEPRLANIGAGSTTIAPLYASMSKVFFHEKSHLNQEQYKYIPLNSEVGLDMLKHGKVGYVSMDRPLTPYERLSLDAFQFPTLIYGVTIAVNIPGIEDRQLRLSRKTLPDIFLGKITRWNDPKLAADNPELTLPDLEIVLLHPSTDSDITFTMTNYLSVISAEWANNVGRGMGVKWPVGIGETDDPDIGHKIENTLGGIGFFESGFISQYKISSVLLENASGRYVAPIHSAIDACIPFFDENVFYDYSEVQARLPGPECYPLVGMNYTVVLLNRSPTLEQTTCIAEFWEIISWMFDHGDLAEEMGTIASFLPQRFLKKIYEEYARESRASPENNMGSDGAEEIYSEF